MYMKGIISVFGLLRCIDFGGSRAISSEEDARLQIERDLDILCNDRGLCTRIAAVRKTSGLERADRTKLYHYLEYEAEAIAVNKIPCIDDVRNGSVLQGTRIQWSGYLEYLQMQNGWKDEHSGFTPIVC